MIQTSYVPLEHPYQIIEYNGKLGIQIGTLIVTKDVSSEKNGDYAIETHSHPVVTYVNKETPLELKKHMSLSKPRPFEGVVWDDVELYELNVVTRVNEELSWEDYMELCKKIRLCEMGNYEVNAEMHIMNNYGLLHDWGINVAPPKTKRGGERVLHVEVAGMIQLNGKTYCHTRGDMGIIVEYADTMSMFIHIMQQAKSYISFMEHFDIEEYKVKFWTQDMFMQKLTDMLKIEEKSLHYPIDEFEYETPEELRVLMASEDVSPVDE
jgi:hypothetical protein